MYIEPEDCHVEEALNSLTGKWKSVILLHLLKNEVLRFNELQKSIPDITQKMLTKHLRELEDEGIVNRVVYAQVPPKVEYSLTPYGTELSPILHAMHQWGERHALRRQKSATE